MPFHKGRATPDGGIYRTRRNSISEEVQITQLRRYTHYGGDVKAEEKTPARQRRHRSMRLTTSGSKKNNIRSDILRKLRKAFMNAPSAWRAVIALRFLSILVWIGALALYFRGYFKSDGAQNTINSGNMILLTSSSGANIRGTEYVDTETGVHYIVWYDSGLGTSAISVRYGSTGEVIKEAHND